MKEQNFRADIIIITHNGWDLTRNCLDSLLFNKSQYKLNITIVDNASADDTPGKIRELYSNINLIESAENLGYAKAVNLGMKSAASPIAIIANNDIIFFANTIDELLTTVESDNSIAVCGPQQLHSDGTKQRSYGDLPSPCSILKELFLLNSIKNIFRKFGIISDLKIKAVPYLDGACLAVRRSAFDEVGGFDEDYFFYTEEADFCKRLSDKSFRIVFNPKSKLTHLRGGANSQHRFNEQNTELLVSTKVLYCKKHLNNKQTKRYIRLSYLNNLTKSILLRFFYFFNQKEKLNGKLEYFELVTKHWKNQINE